MVIINFPSIQSDNLKYVSVELINSIEELPEKKITNNEIEKPKSPDLKSVKKQINPSVPIEKPLLAPLEKPPAVPLEKPIIEEQKEEITNIESNEIISPDLPLDKPIIEKDLFDDMLKDLAEKEPVQNLNKENMEVEKNTETTNKVALAPFIIKKIWQQIKDNYEFPPAMENSEAMAVKIRIHLRTDGTIVRIVRASQAPTSDPRYLAYLEAAERALRKLEKFDDLPVDEYSMWRLLEIDFYPYGLN